MTSIVWIKFFPSDWLHGTRTLTPTERGVYITILSLIYDEGGPIEHNRKRLARECNMRTPQLDEALDSLIELGKFSVVDGAITNPKSTVIIADAVSRQQKAVKGGNALAAKKAQQNQENAPARAQRKQRPSTAQAQHKHSASNAKLELELEIASKLATRGMVEGEEETLPQPPTPEPPPSADTTLEDALRWAADWHHDGARLSHVKPIQDLIDRGLSLDADIIPTVRQLAPSATYQNSWGYFVGPLEDILRRRTEPKGGAAHASTDGSAPKALPRTVWLWADSPEFEAWQAHRTDGRKWPTSEKRHPLGGFRPGWNFPSEWPPGAESKGADPPREAASA